MNDEERKAVAKLARLVAGLAILVRDSIPYTNAVNEVIEHAQQVDAQFSQPQTKEPTDDT